MRDIMKSTPRSRNFFIGVAIAAPCMAVLAQPTQRPLLVNTSGAKPNLMISLDNSASMVLPFPDEYRVGNYKKSGDAYWAAQRSAAVNHLYYNPRITYLPRLGPDGKPLVPNDSVVFISNQESASFEYFGYANTSTPQVNSSYVFDHSSYASRQAQPSGWYKVSQETETAIYSPVHKAYKVEDVNPTPPAFTYALCTSISASATDQKCLAWSFVNVTYGSSALITLPAGHSRTDCGPTTCTTAQEIQNILTWYRYYLYRMPATATAIGQALNDPRLNNRIRVGYLPINYLKEAITLTPGTDNAQPEILRGVRTWINGSTDNKQVYDWLYNQLLMGSTPLHNSVEKVATYLQVPSGAKENPWAGNPAEVASSSNPEMSCRRSYNLVFSDGAWSSSSSTIKGLDFDNKTGPTFARSPTDNFSYSPQGGSSNSERKLYTPFPSSGTGGLADLTAQYYWHKDLRDNLENRIATRAGQPTFWQNMTTYTVGYLIKPTGLLPAATSGLTFDQIEAYRTDFVTNGYSAATKPSWPTGDMTSNPEAERIDDFIQAGYTGGGRGFSVQNAEEIKGVFDSVLSDILNAAGSDAGIELTSPEPGVTTVDGSLKYGVDFRTVDNSGDVRATLLDAMGNGVKKSMDVNGNVLNPASADYWTASKQIPDHTARKIFSMGYGITPFEFKGAFGSLPIDVQAALKTSKDKDRIPTDSRFVDYLRGKDPATDAQSRLFRPRLSPIGAIVNAAPLLMGDEDHLRYETKGDVSGKDLYAAYRAQIKASSASLFVATNAGVVHAFSADKGKELAAFMPRRSMTKLLDQANINAGFSYALDGPMTRNDIFTGNQWNQIAIGTGGRGEKLIYGLRSPLKPNGDRTPDVSDFLWEVGPDTINTATVITGHMTNPVRSGQTDSGHWVAVVNSGHYNGEAGGIKAGLVVLNAMTGTLLRSIPLPATFSAGRGLGGVTLERDARRRIVAAYAGDANGNLWRFDLRGAPAAWKVAYGKPLFTTANNRPIYAAPAWQAHPVEGNIVVIATGIALEDADLADTSINESIYGIWDPTSRTGVEKAGFETVQLDKLLKQSKIKLEKTANGVDGYSVTENVIDWAVHEGWFLHLNVAPGERSIDQVRNLGSSIEVNTVALDSSTATNAESCTAADLPTNAVYVLNALDGSGGPAFDVDGDGVVDEVAMVVIDEGGYSRNISLMDFLGGDDGILESQGEGDAEDPNCKGAKFGVFGLGNGALMGEKKCTLGDPKPWSLQQYQLTKPPL